MINKEFQEMLDKKLPMVEFNDELQKFKVTIEEHVVQTFEVEAINIEEAMEIAERKYYKGEFVLEQGEVSARLMMAEDEYGAEATEWEEF